MEKMKEKLAKKEKEKKISKERNTKRTSRRKISKERMNESKICKDRQIAKK